MARIQLSNEMEKLFSYCAETTVLLKVQGKVDTLFNCVQLDQLASLGRLWYSTYNSSSI